jgi:Trk-type K+ transport system membrane component
MSTLSFSPTVKVFPCPNCHETINTSMQQCAFCGVPIDSAAAEASAAFTSRISAAVSDASYLSILGWALITFTVLMFVPFLGLLGGVGLIVLRVAIPIMAIRWWIRYGKLKSADPDLKKARTRAIVMTVVAAFLIVDTGFNFVHKRTPPSAPVNINVPMSTASP